MANNEDKDLFKDFNITRSKPLNLIYILISREFGSNSSTLGLISLYNGCSNRNELTVHNHLKRIYLAITPNYTIINVKTPICYLRRFSLDGKYLIA